MLLTRIRATDFLSFRNLDLAVGPGITVVTGPNGVGKSNLGRCLDVARSVISWNAGERNGASPDLFQSAGRNGATSFRIALDLTIDQPRDRQLVLTYMRAAYACGGFLNDAEAKRTAAAIDAIGRARIVENSLTPLWTGTLHVHYDAAYRNSWFAAWEFEHAGQTCHITLVGSASGQLRGGPADAAMQPEDSSFNLTRLLTSSAPGQDIACDPHGAPMDLGMALPSPHVSASMHVSAPADMSTPVPHSLRELAFALNVKNLDQRSFDFIHVISDILNRRIILTDNRRLPFNRRFTLDMFDQAIDLRDGRDIPAELFRLKNGPVADRRRYSQIKEIFQKLTLRVLALRAYPEPSTASLIIEPVIVTSDSEQHIEFAGAGAQEALVLSTLLTGDTGRIIVLDEPAVHVEPTMQRRLTSLLRNTGQRLVITHSPDLVPIDQPNDLANVVRLAPTTDGAEPKRANPISRQEWTRWFKLLEPTHVRALLFAKAVVLCEGPTEIGALRQWWSDTSSVHLPPPEAANIPIVSVNGDHSFGGYIEYLDAFAIPWVIVADGPALRPQSVLARQLADRGRQPASAPPTEADFDGWRKYWAASGVYTVADQFGDDGSKQGEFEAFLRRLDPHLLDRIHKEIGHRSKPQVGALFATEHATMPAEIANLYCQIMGRLGND